MCNCSVGTLTVTQTTNTYHTSHLDSAPRTAKGLNARWLLLPYQPNQPTNLNACQCFNAKSLFKVDQLESHHFVSCRGALVLRHTHTHSNCKIASASLRWIPNNTPQTGNIHGFLAKLRPTGKSSFLGWENGKMKEPSHRDKTPPRAKRSCFGQENTPRDKGAWPLRPKPPGSTLQSSQHQQLLLTMAR